MRSERLKHVADVRVSNVDKKSVDGDVAVRLCNYTDVYYNERISSELDFMTATATPDQRATFALRAGDVVLTKDSETADDIGVSALIAEDIPELVCGYHLAVVRARSDVAYGPYLRWVIAADACRQAMSMAATGVTRFGLRSEAIADLEVPLPPLDEQLAIADYLDRETARIDSLIAAKRKMMALIDERDSQAFDRVVGTYGLRMPEGVDAIVRCPDDFRVMRLSQTLDQLTNGYVGPTREILMDDGIRYVQSLHIKNGEIDFDRGHYFVSPEWHADRPRIHLREGDVLIVQTGDIGQVAVVPAGFGEASCHALQIARVRPSIISGLYLGAYLRSPFGQASLLSRATGALHPHLEAGIKDIPVVVPPLQLQRAIVDEVREAQRADSRLKAAIDRQVALMSERRQALVTAAVTGRIDVPMAA